nr:DUF1949 domain-containing protein [Propionibacterium sp.]
MVLWLPAGYRAETELEVRRSRFITTLARVDTEDAARAVIAETRQRYPDARHHCSAFIVEVPDAQSVERSSDDGEPSGTAGMPMLDVLRGAGVAQAVAVVTRYFGGVLLGTGGLVRAYSDSVARALDAAGRVRPVVQTLYAVEVGHAEFGRLQADLLAAGLTVTDVAFAERATLTVACPPDLDADVPAIVGRLTHGTAAARPAGRAVAEEPTG